MWSLLALLPLIGVAIATPEVIERNLAYRSPYVSHPGLGIDTADVHRRHLAARDEVRHEMRKRQQQAGAPTGKPEAYPAPGYGLGVVDWTDADAVYAGKLNFSHGIASGRSNSIYGLAHQKQGLH